MGRIGNIKAYPTLRKAREGWGRREQGTRLYFPRARVAWRETEARIFQA